MPTYSKVSVWGSSWVVPAGVSSIDLYASGAYTFAAGPYAGFVKGTLAVTPGQVITGVGGQVASTSAGGAPDGRAGNGTGTGGSGSTTITVDGVVVLVGPGAGGTGNNGSVPGGAGGYPNGADGSGSAAGKGGTQSANGAGTLGTNGGGGGGGFHQGGDGGNGSGGGGGSGFIHPSLTATSSGVETAGAQAYVVYRNPITPPAPTIIAPTAGGAAAAGVVRMSWQYGGEDTQAGASVEWRVSGGTAGAPATITDATPYTEQTLTPGDWEWRVNNTSQDGLTGPWSPWTPFHVETKPATPGITSPVDGSTLTDVPTPIAWTGTALAWQAQIVNAADGSIIWDSGTQSGTATATTGQATVNNITVVVRVRLKGIYVYSDWAAVTCPVAWVGPVAPVVQARADPDAGAIGVEWTQPATSVAVDHYRLVAIEKDQERIVASEIDAALRAVTDRLPLSDIDIQYRLEAVATSGAYTSSPVIS